MANFVQLFLVTVLAFVSTAGLAMLATALPSAAPFCFAIIAIAAIAGLIWWLHDGDLVTGLAGCAVFVGALLGYLSTRGGS